ncbi:hypothetical protein KsCSTR_02540 [Candidatus Kuenenia stuttgartiensis]|uniref:Uncharacterized protein n=1 Tax=Kuenenia stuttgartiensis TaxID=174633 RepID=Q1PY65_KUEST|nr:hypothetical protein KsCSTR_02540 [Candidatus Kuenenia stuttgartiensis]CAJ72976.1 unknown protein [Candidatus Kuenenia stuttgartiensis]
MKKNARSQAPAWKRDCLRSSSFEWKREWAHVSLYFSVCYQDIWSPILSRIILAKWKRELPIPLRSQVAARHASYAST